MILWVKQAAFAVFVTVIASLLLSPLGLGIIGGIDTDGQDGWSDGWLGHMELSDIRYATSWISNADSEDITVQGTLSRPSGTATADPNYYRYVAYVNGREYKTYPADTNENDWDDWEPANIGAISPMDVHHLKSWTFQIRGDVVGEVKVEMEVHFGKLFASYNIDLGYDEAYLESGRGEIHLEGNQGPFEEGGQAKLFVRTGFTGGEGWTVKLYSPPDRPDLPSVIETWDLNDDVQTYVYVDIESGYFKAGSTNEFRAELWNHLFDVGFEQVFAVFFLDRIPIMTDVSYVDNDNYFTYTVTAEATFAPLSHLKVYAWYGYGGTTLPSTADLESWVIFGDEFDITDGVASFNVEGKNMAGSLIVKCFVYDQDGRVSEPFYHSFEWDGAGTGDDNGDPLTNHWELTIWAILIAATGLIILGAYTLLTGWQKWKIKLVIITIGSVITFIATYGGGLL